jgi:hypothetical protein
MRSWKHVLQVGLLLTILILSLGAASVFAASKTANASGNWSNAAIWTPAGVPGNNDDVTIPTGITVTLDVNTVNMRSLTVDAGGTFQGDGTGKVFLYGRGGGEDFRIDGTLNGAGARAMTIRLNRNSQWAGSGTIHLSFLDISTRTLSWTAGTTMNVHLDGAGDPIIGTGSINVLATTTFTYNGTSAQLLSSLAGVTYNHLVITNPAGVALQQNLTATNLLGNLTVTGGGVLRTGIGNAVNNITGSATHTLTVGAGSTLYLSSGVARASSFPTGFTTVALDQASTVEYGNSSSGNQTVSLAPTYGNLTLSGSGTKTVPTGTLTLLGDWANNSTGAVNFTAPQTVTFGAAASAGRSIAGSTSTAFNNLTVDNAAGVTLALNATVNGTLALGANKVVTGSNVLILGNAGSVSRTSGYVHGNLRKSVAVGSPSVSFEIGDASVYAPVTAAFTGVTGSGTLTASTTAGDHPNLSSSMVDPSKGANRYWTLTNGATAFTSYDATFNFSAGDVDGGATPANFLVGRYSGGAWSAPSVGTAGATSTQATGLTGFGDFALGEAASFSITSSAGSNGTISPDGVTTLAFGGSQSYTITANTGYHVADVLVDGVSVGAVTSYPFSSVGANHTISASFAIDVFTITASSGANGSVTPDGGTSVNYGDGQTYTIAPNAGYHVEDVLVDGSSVGAVTSYPFTNVTANHTISATFAIDTMSITASAGANGSIAPAGVTAVLYGGDQSYTITPATGYHVADVLVDGSSVGAVTSYPFTNVTANHTIDASFAIDSFSVSASAGSGGSISPAGVTMLAYGESQGYTVTADTGYHIADVLVDGISIGAASSHTFSAVDANHTISATFAIDTFTVSASALANGSVSPSGDISVTYGGTQSVTMHPDAGYHVADVLVDGVSVGAVLNHTFTDVKENHTLVASFAIDAFEVTATSGPNGTVTPAGVTGVNYGADLTYAITPDTGYHIASLVIDGDPITPVPSYQFGFITGNHTISATFAIDTFTVTASAGAHGTIAPDGVTTLTYGGSQSYTMTPEAGYHVADVLVDGSSVGAPGVYDFTAVAANHTIDVSFAIDTFAITAQAVGGGVISPSGTVVLTYGDDQEFTITPNTGFFIADVHVDTSSVGAVGSYTFNDVAANHAITATFDTLRYVVTATAGSNGSISPAGATTVAYDGSIDFTITPATGFHIADVHVDSVSVGAVSNYTLSNITADHAVSASFAIDTFHIVASAGLNGSITPSGTVDVTYGSSQSFTFTPETGFLVASVTVDGVDMGALSSYTFSSVDSNHTISVTFDVQAFTISASSGPHGAISPSGAVGVVFNGSRTFTITPDTGFVIADVVVDSVSVGALGVYTFTDVVANHTIHATFDTLKLTVTATADSNGTITPSGAVQVNYGANASFTIAAAPGYFIADVHVDTVSVGAVTSYTFTDVRANHTIHASFVVNSAPSAVHLLAPVQGDTLTISPAADSLNFAWSASTDPDAVDNVMYGFHVWGPGVDSTVAGLSDTTLALILPGLQLGMTYQWTASSTDGNTSVASADTFSFVIDFSSGVGEGAGLPTVYELHQNFPNPFNPTTRIKFDLPASSVVNLSVYNLIGQEVRTLLRDQAMGAGYQEVGFDGASLPSGVYLYRLSAKNGSEASYISVKKMIMIK